MRIIYFLIFSLFGLIIHAQTAEEAKMLHEKGRTFLNEGKIAEGRECTKKAMDMRRQLFGEVNEDYITSLNNYANTFVMEESYSKGIELYRQVLELCSKLPTPHSNWGLFVTNIGRAFYLKGDKTEATKYFNQALSLVEKHGELYEFLLNTLGLIYDENSDVAGLERIMGLMEEHNRHELEKECNEPVCMLERAQYYMAIGNNADAKNCFLKALGMPMDDIQRIKLYENYAQYHFKVNDFQSASEYQLMAARLEEKANGRTEKSANLMYTSAVYSFIGGLYPQAIDCYLKVIDFYSNIDSSVSLSNVTKCNKGIGNAYNAMKDYEKAKNYFQEVVAYYEANDMVDNEYPKAIMRLADAEKFNKEYDSSILHYQQAMKLFEERNMMEDYGNAASSLQLCYAYAGKSVDVSVAEDKVKAARYEKLDRIIREETETLELTRKYLGKLMYARSLAVIAGSYAMKEDYMHAVDYYKKYMVNIREGIRDEFRLQSEAERLLTWNEEVANIRSLQELLVTLPIGNEQLMDDMAALVYDSELLSKGILLNSSIEFEKVLQTKNDKNLINVYNLIKKNEEEIQRVRENATTDLDLEPFLGLMEQNQELQLKLYKDCSEFADFTDYISYNWADVQQAMNDNDVAIEFAAIGSDVWDEYNYMAALVITKEMTSPMAIPICNLAEAKAMANFKQLFEQKDNLIWGKLDVYMKGKQRIFFSADGVFNHIGIEYLQYNGKPLSEQFEVYRLSSTKELCHKKEKIKPINAVLFGDINYNDIKTLSKSKEGSLSDLRGVGGSENFADLGNTLKEIDEIQMVLKHNKVKKIVRLADVEANKNAFLRLTNSYVNILHIATHGVYYNKKNSTDVESMDNSILAFAGANLGDEGLVTASEVAKMNLRQCDLAVLSACETGLGKLGNDGVFGLQRGFKNAGVRTLLMSLKKVYDYSTAEMMICFYNNLMKGQSKREALVNAQKEIRDKGFSESKYWASFILLDALEN